MAHPVGEERLVGGPDRADPDLDAVGEAHDHPQDGTARFAPSLCPISHPDAAAAGGTVRFRIVSEGSCGNEGGARDRAAARRDVDAGIRDRLADDDMPDIERDARIDAARDRMAAMRDRQAAARDRDEAARRDRPDAPGDA
jgi:hypothetical protein